MRRPPKPFFEREPNDDHEDGEEVDYTIPDKFGVEIGYRGWYLDQVGQLRSLTHSEVAWEPSKPMIGSCRARQSRPTVSVKWKQVPEDGMGFVGGVYIASADAFASLPEEEPADGNRWEPVVVEKWSHLGPVEKCSCGVYSLSRPDWPAIASYYHAGDQPLVLGTVKLWGKIIPGNLGRKSQYAYPNELWVIAEVLSSVSYEPGVRARSFGKSCARLDYSTARDIASKLAERYDCYARAGRITHIAGVPCVQEIDDEAKFVGA